jgi:hypothetical protein
LGALVVAAAVIAGCGRSGGPKAVSSSAELGHDLDTRGVGCAGYEPATPSEKQKHVDQQAYCQILGESAILYVFKTATDLRSWITLGVEAGCSFGLPTVDFVQGPNWIIQVETTAVTQAIKAQLGGSAQVHRC